MFSVVIMWYGFVKPTHVVGCGVCGVCGGCGVCCVCGVCGVCGVCCGCGVCGGGCSWLWVVMAGYGWVWVVVELWVVTSMYGCECGRGSVVWAYGVICIGKWVLDRRKCKLEGMGGCVWVWGVGIGGCWWVWLGAG